MEDVYQYFVKRDLLRYNDIYNVNIPLNRKEIRITRQGGPYYQDTFVALGNDMYQQNGYCCYVPSADMTLDTDAVMNHFVSITPLTVDRTSRTVFTFLQDQ